MYACCSGLWAQALTPLARQYRESPTPARREALLKFAAGHPQDKDGALALLCLGVTAEERGDHPAALGHLKAAAERLPELADYVSYFAGLASAGLKDYAGAAAWLDNVGGESPLAGRAALAAARGWGEAGDHPKAIAVIRRTAAGIPQPEGDLLLATALEQTGAASEAAYHAQRVYYGYPDSKEAAEAGRMLERLRERLGADYPPPLPEAMLGRAARWLAAGNHARARREYEELATQLGGAERDLARVRAGAARYQGGAVEAALRYLEDLRVETPDADAERLYYLVQCARRLEQPEAMRGYLDQLRAKHANSEWRMGALVWAGNYYLLRNETASYVPLFRSCAEEFPASGRADYCFWKVAWSAYIGRSSEAAGLLEEYLRRFPEGEKAPAALYFLGGLGGDEGRARDRYRQILQHFPNNYYAALAEERLKEPAPRQAARLNFEPDATARHHIARSRLLASAGLAAWADGELRGAAQTAAEPQVYAMELARQAAARNAPDQGVRHIKGAFPGYLATPFEAAPVEFWRLAFPLAYRAPIERYAKAQGLAVDLVAGLIRQESEFSPTAVSSANARGLMQILPPVGRQLAARLKIRGFGTASLFRADLNIRLGTYYLRTILDSYDGSLEAALAAYNGGKTRIDQWLSWAEFREPAEFVETIPITETRGYVQAVLRNAWLYRRIYMEKAPAAASKAQKK